MTSPGSNLTQASVRSGLTCTASRDEGSASSSICFWSILCCSWEKCQTPSCSWKFWSDTYLKCFQLLPPLRLFSGWRLYSGFRYPNRRIQSTSFPRWYVSFMRCAVLCVIRRFIRRYYALSTKYIWRSNNNITNDLEYERGCERSQKDDSPCGR